VSASERSTIRLQLIGAREAIAQLGATATAVDEVGVAQKRQGLSALTASERTWLHNQALFTLRRYAYAGTLALTALVAETLRWGYQFNQTMASSRAALHPIIQDSSALNSELTQLYNFTKKTPFQFKDMTIAFRQMYVAFQPLGISVGDTNQVLYGLVNALSEAGRTSPGALNRVSVALQHMAYMGHLTGQTVLQLARDGIPIFNILQKQLGLTGEELHNVGTLGIPTATVLKAISDYLNTNPIFAGAAARQAQTFSGMLTTLKDNVSQLMGALTLGSYSRGPGFLANLNKTFDLIGNKIQQNAAAGKGMAITWDQATSILSRRYPILVNVFRALDLIWLYVKLAGSVITQQFLPALRNAMVFAIPLFLALKIGGSILLLLSQHTKILSFVMWILISRFILFRTWAIAYVTYTKLMAFWEGVLATKTMILTAWELRMSLAQITALDSTIALTRGQKVLIFTTGLVSRAFVAARLLAATMTTAFFLAGGGIAGLSAAFGVLTGSIMTFLAAIPIIGWIALAITALILLYFKWSWFHNFVNHSLTWIIDHWKIVAAVILVALGPIGLVAGAVIALIGHFRSLVGWAREAGKWIGNAWHHVPGHGLVSGAAHLIGLAAGGQVTRSGAFLVGEQGPEIVSLPTGANVSANATPGTALRAQPSGGIQLPDLYATIITKIGEKAVGEAVAKVRLDAAARA
jgi:tape measure domain-containing protein